MATAGSSNNGVGNVSDFVAITGAEETVATYFLTICKGDLEAAMNYYYRQVDDDKRHLVLIGNTGSGKSWLLNRMVDAERFESGINVDGVTTKLEYVTLEDLPEPVTLFNIPGLVEADPENLKRNQRVLEEALSRGGRYKLIFVFAAGIGGRIQPKDILAYQEVCKGYHLPNLPIIMNNLQLDAKSDEEKDEKLKEYWVKLIKLLEELGIKADCQVIEQDANREDILRKLFAAADSFPWQQMPYKPKAMNFNEYDSATQAAMRENDRVINGLVRQLERNEVEKQRLIERARVREQRQREAFERHMASVNQHMAKLQNKLSYAQQQRASTEQQLSSMSGQVSNLQHQLNREQQQRSSSESSVRSYQNQVSQLQSELSAISSRPPTVVTHYVERSSGGCVIC